MFVGMSFCLPLAYWLESREKKRVAAEGEAGSALLGEEEAGPPDHGWRGTMMLAIPSFFDLIATILMNIGLLSVTASVYQMMRGAEMLFAALFAIGFLGRRLNHMHYKGIACCITGIALVGWSSTMSGEGSASHPVSQRAILVGMALIVASQCVQAAQLTFEDYFMADMAIEPLKIVGFEGVFGSVAMLCVLLPIVQWLPGKDGGGLHEDSIDTLTMLRNTPVVTTFILVDMAALLAFNVSGMCVTGHFGAVFRTVLETTRTLFVWLVGLLLYYTPLGMGKLGESWNSYSWVQAAGFVILVSGTIIYGKGDDAELAEDIATGEYVEVIEPAVSGLIGTAPAAAIPVSQLLVTPSAIPISSSMRSTMNISSFSVPRNASANMARSLSARRGSAPRSPGGLPMP